MKKNNPVVLLLLILIMGTVSACGFGGKTDDDASALEYNGVTFSIKDENMDNVYAAFGEPEDTEGDRPGYYYTFDSGMVGVSSFIINEIYEDRRQEFPDMISIKDERIKTSKGIGVGSAEEEVKTAYGKAEAFDLDGMSILSYSFDGYQMVFVVDKTVVEIQYVRGS